MASAVLARVASAVLRMWCRCYGGGVYGADAARVLALVPALLQAPEGLASWPSTESLNLVGAAVGSMEIAEITFGDPSC